ncbi:MAG: hypothetical protein OSB09_11575 [Planctomycetota bacterium]|nr:hypothetical protein [Planctomycetota bacterium]
MIDLTLALLLLSLTGNQGASGDTFHAAPSAAQGPVSWVVTADLVKELEADHDAAAAQGNRREVAQQFQPKFVALAKELAGSESGLSAELWLLRNHWWKRSEGTMEQVSIDHAKRLIEEYSTSTQLAHLAEFSYLYGREALRPLMDSLVAASPHDQVDAAALHALGSSFRRSKDPDDQSKAREHLIQLRDRYGSLVFRDTTYGAIASAMLSPHSKDALSVGQQAPEISGADVNGKSFRLTDHLGKIILLDFWGDW